MICPNCQCSIPDTARKCPICSELSKVKGKPVPEASLPVEKLLLFGGLGLGAALLLWGAALLMRPVAKVAPPPPVERPAPPPPPADVITDAPVFPAMNFPPPPPPAPAPAAAPARAPAPATTMLPPPPLTVPP